MIRHFKTEESIDAEFSWSKSKSWCIDFEPLPWENEINASNKNSQKSETKPKLLSRSVPRCRWDSTNIFSRLILNILFSRRSFQRMYVATFYEFETHISNFPRWAGACRKCFVPLTLTITYIEQRIDFVRQTERVRKLTKGGEREREVVPGGKGELVSGTHRRATVTATRCRPFPVTGLLSRFMAVQLRNGTNPVSDNGRFIRKFGRQGSGWSLCSSRCHIPLPWLPVTDAAAAVSSKNNSQRDIGSRHHPSTVLADDIDTRLPPPRQAPFVAPWFPSRARFTIEQTFRAFDEHHDDDNDDGNGWHALLLDARSLLEIPASRDSLLIEILFSTQPNFSR